jgi:hypothetical protein
MVGNTEVSRRYFQVAGKPTAEEGVRCKLSGTTSSVTSRGLDGEASCYAGGSVDVRNG